MSRTFLAAFVAFQLHASAWAGPQEKSAPTSTPNLGSPQIVMPVVLMPAGLTTPALTGTPTIPSALQNTAGAPTTNSATALPPSALATQPQAGAAEQGRTQAAPASPPSGPPNGPDTTAAPGGGGPPNGPHRAPEDGPVPNSPSGGSQAQASPVALLQLKAELADLQKQEKQAKALVSAAPSVSKEYRGGEAEARGRAHERVAQLSSLVDAKKAEVASARQAEFKRYSGIKDEVAALKKERDTAKGLAASGGANGRDYKGGADEARGRALEQVAALDSAIAAKKKALALIERDNPSFAGLRAPVVVVRNALGLEPKTDAEKTLIDEIRSLDSRAAKADVNAEQMFHLNVQHPDIGASEEGIKHRQEAAALRKQAAAKRAELKTLRGR